MKLVLNKNYFSKYNGYYSPFKVEAFSDKIVTLSNNGKFFTYSIDAFNDQFGDDFKSIRVNQLTLLINELNEVISEKTQELKDYESQLIEINSPDFHYKYEE